MIYFAQNSKSGLTLYIFITFLITNITLSGASPTCTNLIKKNTGNMSLSFPHINTPRISKGYEMDIIEYFYEIMPCSTHTFKIIDLPPTIHFVVLHMHSYFYDMTLRYTSQQKVDQKVVGTNIGLVQIVDATGTVLFNLENKHVFSVSVLLAVLGYGRNAPIPGGCNMEFEVEMAPYMKINYSSALIEVEAQPAQLPNEWIYSFNKLCTPNLLDYETYQLYLPQNDYTSESYFTGIRQMLSVARIKQNGRKVIPPTTGPELRRTYSTYYGTGSIYAMIVSAGNNEYSAYVPIHTYTCRPEYNSGTCFVHSAYSMLSSLLLGVVGVFLCFIGNKHSKCELIVMSGLFFALILFLLLMDLDSINLSDQECAAISLIAGLIIGKLFLCFVEECDHGILVIAYIFDSLMLGILVAAIMFYTPISDLSVFDDNLQYWIVYCMFVLIVALMLRCREKAIDGFAPAIIGAYAIILCLELSIFYSNLRYIIINPVRLATVNGFETAAISPPYQTMDFVMITLWIILSVYGIYLQPKKSFPISPETTPILNNSPRNNSSYGSTFDSNYDNVFFSDSDNLESQITQNV